MAVIAEGETGHAFSMMKALMPWCKYRFRYGNITGICFAGVGDENLVAVQNPVLAIEYGSGFGFTSIGPGIGFGQAESSQFLLDASGSNIFLLFSVP